MVFFVIKLLNQFIFDYCYPWCYLFLFHFILLTGRLLNVFLSFSFNKWISLLIQVYLDCILLLWFNLYNMLSKAFLQFYTISQFLKSWSDMLSPIILSLISWIWYYMINNRLWCSSCWHVLFNIIKLFDSIIFIQGVSKAWNQLNKKISAFKTKTIFRFLFLREFIVSLSLNV